MKGAIGNAFILNMVITFIIIFYVLLIGAVAYSKAYKINTFLMNSLISYDEIYGIMNENSLKITDDNNYLVSNNDASIEVKENGASYVNKPDTWNKRVNDYLGKIGYIINNSSNTCPSEIDEYTLLRGNKNDYDYCIYIRYLYNSDVSSVAKKDVDPYIDKKYMYKVVSYMKFDFPIIGEFIKLPITSESKVILNFH